MVWRKERSICGKIGKFIYLSFKEKIYNSYNASLFPVLAFSSFDLFLCLFPSYIPRADQRKMKRSMIKNYTKAIMYVGLELHKADPHCLGRLDISC